MEDKIPVIDFSKFSLTIKEENARLEDIQELAKQICEALKSVGFLYLKNYGIDQDGVDGMHSLIEDFVALNPDVKKKYERKGRGVEYNHGWCGNEKEGLNSKRPADLKEAFDVQSHMEDWPNEIPGFERKARHFFQLCTTLANRILYLIGVGLKLDDPGLFRANHNPYTKPCSTHLRLVRYPITPVNEFKKGQLYCGEHTDNGTISLLFQDNTGGLEVKTKTGDYIPATPIPETIVVNAADLLQRWTADTLKSTWHRVVAPTTESSPIKARTSVIYFAHPDQECLIECVDGSNKHPPILAGDHVNNKYAEGFVGY